MKVIIHLSARIPQQDTQRLQVKSGSLENRDGGQIQLQRRNHQRTFEGSQDNPGHSPPSQLIVDTL